MAHTAATAPRWEIIRRGRWLQAVSPRGFEFSRLHLPIPGLAPELAGLRILHLTDMHVRARWRGGHDDLIAAVAADPPDLIAITGDVLESKYDPDDELIVARRLLTSLPSRFGSFAILGNHDGDLLGPYFAEWGVTLVDNRRATLRFGNAVLELFGAPGLLRSDAETSYVFSLGQTPPGVMRIVFAHFPDLTPLIARDLQPQLVLAGHTHGGQVCLPGGIPLMTHDSLPRDHVAGLHKIDQTWLLVSRGYGFAQLAVRTFCSAQVTEVRLIPAD